MSIQIKKVSHLQIRQFFTLLTLVFLVFMFGSEAQAAPGFTLTPSASSITLAVGYNGPINIVITDLNGFSGKISFAASGVPAGVTAAFATAGVNTTSVTFTRSSTAAAGTYSVKITGTSNAVTSQTTIAVTILPQSFTLSSSASALTLPVGGTSASATISITGQNGFSSNVSLTASGLPSGVTATFSSPSTASKSTVTLTASSVVVPGSYTVTVKGTSGSLTSTTTIALTIPTPSFTISPSASTLNLLVGASASSAIAVTSGKGSVVSVALTASGLPSGVSATFSPATTTAASTLNFTASSTVVPGTYTVTVKGTFKTVTSTTTIALTIPAPSFSVSSSASTLNLLVGGGASSTISVAQAGGSVASVALTAAGLPSGVTAAFSLATTTTTSSLTLTASSTVAPGTYTVTVKGTFKTVSNTTTIALTIPAPSFSISSSASTLNLPVAGSTITVTQAAGSVASIALTATGLPAGVTATFSPATTTTTSSLTLTASSTVVPGSYTVTVKGAFKTVTSTTTIALTIPSSSFSVSSSASTLNLPVAGSAGSTITVAQSGGSVASVALTATGLPAGVTATFSPATTTTTSSLTLAASSAVVSGSYTVTVKGTSGTLSSSTTITLTIPASSFSISSSASTLNLLVSGSAGSTITVAQSGGSAVSVALTATGLPAGVTATFSPATTTATSSLTLTASSTVVSGSYIVTVTGTSGTLTSSTTITLTIPSSSFSISSSASTLSLADQGSASSTISVTTAGGLAPSVALTVAGLPTGVAATFSPSTTSTTSTLTFAANNDAVAGSFTATVTGTSGTLTGSTAIAITIPAPNFTISSSASTLSLLAGVGNGSSTISVNQTGGAVANVALTASGLPAGVTATFSPATTNSTSTLTFTASSTAVAGSYTATVTGNSGTVTSSTTIALTISTSGFVISSSASVLNLLAGIVSTSTINVAQVGSSNFNVTLTATGLPTGVTAVFGPAITSTTSLLTLLTLGGVAPGSYPVTVTGTSGTTTSTTNITLTIPGPISIAITQPTYGFNVLPGSVRRIYATVSNGVTNAVSWSVTGGATLSSSTGNWVDVTAPATGTSCSINGTGPYTISSATQFTLAAQSEENPSATSSITVNVCNPAVQVQVVPFYATAYSDQQIDVQAFVWGSVNRNVTWAITSQPNGGNGVLADSANMDTVFSASVAGRYILTATSVANPSITNTATVFVTGNSMTYSVTPSNTMPVDCTVDPELTGTTYNIGPSQTYKTISSVPWASLTAGSTVRIHNEDTTGGNPTTYHEYFLLTGQGTRTQPIRVCGVPDSSGNLPVIDASNSTTTSSYPANLVGYAAVTVGKGGWAGVYTGTWTGPQDLIVEGLKVQNAGTPNTLTSPSGVAGTAWATGAACVRLFQSVDAVVRGIDANSCSTGIFADFNSTNGYAVVTNTLYEGNHVHGNGVSGSATYHQFYIQGLNEVVQFNVVDQYASGALGSNFKDRGFPDVVRYNHFGDGALRQLDMVDNQDAPAYTSFEGYLNLSIYGAPSYNAIYPSDMYTADLLAAAVEAHHADYVYGNTFVNTTAVYPLHYFSDGGTPDNNRLGTLWFYSNSFYEPTTTWYSWNLFDTAGAGGSDLPATEWPQIQALNNAIWMDSLTGPPYFYWNREQNEFTTFGNNVINSNWGTNNMAGGLGTGWSSTISSYAFQGASNSADTSGVASTIGVSTDPFDVSTFLPNSALVNAGAPLPASAPLLPVRFQYGPAAVETDRVQPLTIGAME